MSNAATHRLASCIGVFAIYAAHEYGERGEISIEPFAAAGLAAASARVPDILEPALHPNHRQFFHSFAVAGLVGYGMYKVYEWEPKDELGKIARFAGLVVGASYLIHLICDAGTPKGLPVI